MSNTAISVEGLSKRYVLGEDERASSFREAVTQTLTGPIRRLRRLADGGGSKEFWALKDVNFEVKQGEVVGVIGRNGAGKSTLLKVLSRITPPTSGRIRLRGRVASLLEVGTGFHPELTGRENIYMNGTMLGMSRAEIRGKFDEIVAFSEIEKFLDTPVKRYSSGMYVRLAFAVAAHLEPEILIVDEVLAVGDAAFQKKCIGRMQKVSASDGRTVLFVSHNMSAIEDICTSSIVMSSGRAAFVGSVEEGMAIYEENAPKAMSGKDVVDTSFATITSVTVSGSNSGGPATFQPLSVKLIVVAKTSTQIAIDINILDSKGHLLVHLDSKDFHRSQALPVGQETVVAFDIADLPLFPGSFGLRIALRDDLSWKEVGTSPVIPFDVGGSAGYCINQPEHLVAGTVAVKARFSHSAPATVVA